MQMIRRTINLLMFKILIQLHHHTIVVNNEHVPLKCGFLKKLLWMHFLTVCWTHQILMPGNVQLTKWNKFLKNPNFRNSTLHWTTFSYDPPMVTVQSTKYPTNITETNGINDSAFFLPFTKGQWKMDKKFCQWLSLLVALLWPSAKWCHLL